MQHEKLYNLHKTIYFLVALFVFKTDKVLGDYILSIAQINRAEIFSFWKQLQ